jgi:hypothetical protein
MRLGRGALSDGLLGVSGFYNRAGGREGRETGGGDKAQGAGACGEVPKVPESKKAQAVMPGLFGYSFSSC